MANGKLKLVPIRGALISGVRGQQMKSDQFALSAAPLVLRGFERVRSMSFWFTHWTILETPPCI